MHNSGKVFAWIVVFGAAAAIFLSAKTLAIRNAWMQMAQKNEADLLKNKEQILVKSRELDTKRSELAQTMLGWDRAWPEVGRPDIDARIDQQGMLTLANLGQTQGIRPDQVLYVFALNPEGSSTYVGDFRVTKPNESNSVARPNWFLRAGNLVPGQFKARVRTMIPNPLQGRLGALDQQLLAADQALQSNKSELARQSQLTDQTGKLIVSRLSEIEGDPALNGRSLPPVTVKGLLSAMVDEEEERNAALSDADRLRRELKRVREAFAETLKANRQLTDSLPQAPSSERRVDAASR